MEKLSNNRCDAEPRDIVEAIEGIQRGLEDVAAGRTKPLTQVFEEIRRRRAESLKAE